MKKLKQTIALLICFSMIFSLIGCGKKKDSDDSLVLNYEGKPNVTANSNTKWIDSDIYGAIDSTLNVSEKDDFYTAVNKDWLLEQEKPNNEHDDVSMLMEGDEVVKSRLISIVSGEDDPEALDGNQVDISNEEILHDQEIVSKFVNAAADWDGRNKAGVEPLRKYIEYINAISSVDELTEYIADIDNKNISQSNFIDFMTYAGAVDAETYRCLISPDSMYVLNEINSYTNMSYKEHEDMRLTDKLVKDILSRLGYDEEYSKKVLKDCYKLEGMLIDHTDQKALSDPDAFINSSSTIDELEKISGNYPFEKVYASLGYTAKEDIRLPDKKYMKYLGRIYKNSNLELFKSYLIVHTINSEILLLDRSYYDEITAKEERYKKNKEKDGGEGDVKETEIKDEWDIVLNKYAMPFVGGPLNVVYVSKYLSTEQKDEIKEIIDEVIDNYHKMIDEEEWLSEPAKEATHEKLDYITIRALYPDKMDSYIGLEFDDTDDLLSMSQKIKAFAERTNAAKVNQPVDKELWDLGQMATTTVNAYYKADDNSINILAGIIAGKNIFNVDNPDEINYARIGTIIGHEISHAFDSSGCNYDKYGYKKSWWDIDDKTTFQLRVNDMSNYYDDISPYPGAVNLKGHNLTGEAIADMGGMSAILRIAKEKENFDYDLFFKSYAELWRTSRSLGMEKFYAENDVHPLAYLRTNVTVMQFDEFVDTYGLKPGDGMYCDPEDRVRVW